MYEIIFSQEFLIALNNPLELGFRLKYSSLVKYSLVICSGCILVMFLD